MSSTISKESMPVRKLKIDLPDSAEQLLLDILDHYPEEDSISLKKVMGLGRIQYKETLPGGNKVTAAVINSKPYTLIYGKSFLEENLEDMDDLVYLTSHELTHLVLDHFAADILKEFKEAKVGESYAGLSYDAMHIIVDCQVNATVYNSLKEEKYLKFIKGYYSKNQMPYCFFRPDGEPEGEELSPELTADLRTLHAKLYSKSGITNKDLIAGLMPWFELQQNNKDKMQEVLEKLLGNHEDLLKNRVQNSHGEELEDLAETVAKNYLNKTKKESEKSEETKASGEEKSPGRQAGKGEQLREEMVSVSLEKIEAAKNIRQRLNNPKVLSPSARIYRAIEHYSPKYPIRSVLPNFHDRRTAAIYSTGSLPIFHQSVTLGSKVKVPCYLDVSGSQSHVIPVMLPVVSRLKKLVGDLVYCFSTEIAETKITSLKLGKYKTTGGTDFNPVLQHIIKHKFKQVIILTDGEASASSNLIEKIKKMKVDITVGWTCNRPQRAPLESIASKTFFVFGEGNETRRGY